MNVAYLLYSDLPNAPESLAGIPGEWVAECREIGDSTDLPQDGKPWKLMTKEELENYKMLHEAEVNSWRATQPVPDDN